MNSEHTRASALGVLPNWDNLDVVDQHPELHHYTTLDGLRGIVGTQSLWATHFGDLNDVSELRHIRGPLEKALTKKFVEAIQRERRIKLRIDRAVKKIGGIQRAASLSAKQMVSLFYASTFTKEEGLQGVKALQSPAFITSFCTHTGLSYESENGLLSQWRGYSGMGGFCIVFETSGLLDLLNQEHLAHSYMNMAIDPVIYAGEDFNVAEIVPNLLGVCDSMISYLLDRRRGELQDIFTDFIKSALFTKHYAFHEEREVRIALRPATEEWRRAFELERKRSLPPPRTILGQEGERRRLVLFGGLNVALPIRRVIVGPALDQSLNAKMAQEILGKQAQVTLSKTPYVERSWGSRTNA